MKSLLRIGLTALAVIAFDTNAQPSALTAQAIGVAQPEASGRQLRLYRGSKIIGTSVRNAKNEKIGVIKDLMLDSRRGTLAYAVVSFGGAGGGRNKYHAIPWRALQPSDDGRYYTLQADQETLNQAPGFDKGKWPDMAEPSWTEDVDRFWSRMVGRGSSGSNELSPGGAAAGRGASSKPGIGR